MLFIADEREDVQKKTFAKWINAQLAKVRVSYIMKKKLRKTVKLRLQHKIKTKFFRNKIT